MRTFTRGCRLRYLMSMCICTLNSDKRLRLDGIEGWKGKSTSKLPWLWLKNGLHSNLHISKEIFYITILLEDLVGKWCKITLKIGKSINSTHLPKLNVFHLNSKCIAVECPENSIARTPCTSRLVRLVLWVLHSRCPSWISKVPFPARRVPPTGLWDAVKIRKNITCPNLRYLQKGVG